MADQSISPDEARALGLEDSDNKVSPQDARALGLEDGSAVPTPVPAASGEERPGALQSFTEHAGQGLLAGFGDEAQAGMQAGLQWLTNKVAELHQSGDPRAPGLVNLLGKLGIDARYSQDMGDVYRNTRDETRRRLAAEQQDHAIASGTGTLTGALLGTAAAPVGEAGSLVGAAKAGAVYGGLQGLGDSDADLTRGQFGQALWDAAKGSAAGAAVGGALHGVASAAAPALQALGQKLEGVGLSQGRRVLLNGADSLSRRAPVSDDAVREALESGAIKAFGTTKGAYQRLEGLTEQQGERYAQIISRLEEMGIKGPTAESIAEDLARKADALEPHTMNRALPAEYRAQAEQLLEKPLSDDGALKLSQAENLKRSLQEQAKYGRIEETPLNEVRRDIASTVRQANEDAIDQAAFNDRGNNELQQLNDEFVPIKQRLGKLIEARNAAERGAAAASKRRMFSLSDNLMMAAGLASGHPGAIAEGAAEAMGNNFLRNRGTSTAASMAYGLGKGLQGGQFVQRIAQTNPALLGRWAPTLTRALQGGQDEVMASHYVLSQTDPDYQRHMQELAQAQNEGAP